MSGVSSLFLSTGSKDVVTIDKIIIDYFNSLFDGNGWGNFLLCLIGMLLTILLVGIIGFEREYQGHNAGLRTHLLVGLGSCIVMILSIYSIGYSSSGNMETMRLAAQVVSGIRFRNPGGDMGKRYRLLPRKHPGNDLLPLQEGVLHEI